MGRIRRQPSSTVLGVACYSSAWPTATLGRTDWWVTATLGPALGPTLAVCVRRACYGRHGGGARWPAALSGENRGLSGGNSASMSGEEEEAALSLEDRTTVKATPWGRWLDYAPVGDKQ
jgi:hypothetical protein